MTTPLNEKGHPGGLRKAATPTARRSVFRATSFEQNGELQPPHSIGVYDRMRSQDAQVGGVLLAISHATTSADWQLDTSGVDDEVAAFVRSEIGMPAPGEAQARRRRRGINIMDHIAEVANTAPWAGFAAFEQTYVVGTPNEGQTGDGEVVHIRKLAPRHPRTIQSIEVDADGGLAGVTQNPVKGFEPVQIGVDRLVMHTHRKEGADWWGRSVMRTAYKHWLLKDIFIKLDAQAVERNSMGVPVGKYAQPEQKAELEEQLQAFRAGEHAYLILPEGCTVELMGVSGSTVDVIPHIEYHDKQIARSALAMFLNLGHDSGARSLGETFHDVFLDAVQTFADGIGETITQHVIRDLVELNFGPDAAWPTLAPGDLKAAQGLPADLLSTLISSDVVRPDDSLEDFIRSRNGLPERNDSTARGATAAEQAGALIRAGFDPADAAAAAGLSDVRHTGARPVTVQAPESGDPVEASQPGLDGLDDLLADLIADHRKRKGGEQ